MNWLGLTFSFTEREYLSLGVNMLTNNLKISDTTETQFFELISFQSDRKIYRKYCCADLRSDSDPLDPLTCWLSISVLTRGFLVISVTPHFAVYNFWKKNNLWGWSCFSKYSKFCADFGNAEKNWENIFRFWDNCISIDCVKHSFLLRGNTIHWVSIW